MTSWAAANCWSSLRATSGCLLEQMLDCATRDTSEARVLRRYLAEREQFTHTERLQARDDALRQALAALSPAPTWPACLALLAGIERFEARVWPRLLAGAPAQDLGEMDTALLRARLASPLPTTARRLWTVLGPDT